MKLIFQITLKNMQKGMIFWIIVSIELNFVKMTNSIQLLIIITAEQNRNW